MYHPLQCAGITQEGTLSNQERPCWWSPQRCVERICRKIAGYRHIYIGKKFGGPEYRLKRKSRVQEGCQGKINIIAVMVLRLYDRPVMTIIAAVDRIVVIRKLVHKILRQGTEKQQHPQPNGCDNMDYPTDQNQNTSGKGK